MQYYTSGRDKTLPDYPWQSDFFSGYQKCPLPCPIGQVYSQKMHAKCMHGVHSGKLFCQNNNCHGLLYILPVQRMMYTPLGFWIAKRDHISLMCFPLLDSIWLWTLKRKFTFKTSFVILPIYNTGRQVSGLHFASKSKIVSIFILSECNGEKESPTVALWTMFFLAQHHDQLRQTIKALECINKAIEHTPTLIELFTVKAKIFKVRRWMRASGSLSTL